MILRVSFFRTKDRHYMLMAQLVVLSMGIHALVLSLAPSWFASVQTTAIEFEIQDRLPEGRNIPRPRIRPKEMPPSSELPAAPAQIPVPMPETPPQMPRVAARVVPLASDLPGPVAPVQPVAVQGPVTATGTLPGPSGQFLTQKDYFDMLRLKIETHKRYPPKARAKYLQGRVGLRFKINSDGSISDLAVIRPARHNSLNRAAIKAVEASAPFTRLPATLFTEPVEIKITLVFELA